jgi:hypothetical protein
MNNTSGLSEERDSGSNRKFHPQHNCMRFQVIGSCKCAVVMTVVIMIFLNGCASTYSPKRGVNIEQPNPSSNDNSSIPSQTDEISLEQPNLASTCACDENRLNVFLAKHQENQRDLIEVVNQLNSVWSRHDVQKWNAQAALFLQGAEKIQHDWSEEGELLQCLQAAIEDTEKKQIEYKEKAVDPNISVKVRAQYEQLAQRFNDLVGTLYDKKIILQRRSAAWEKNVQEWRDHADYIADLLQIGEFPSAEDEWRAMWESINSSLGEFDNSWGGDEEK